MEKGIVKIMNNAVKMETEPVAEIISTITGRWYKYEIETREKLTEQQVTAIMLIALTKWMEGLDDTNRHEDA